jgi:hypothetical protein
MPQTKKVHSKEKPLELSSSDSSRKAVSMSLKEYILFIVENQRASEVAHYYCVPLGIHL